MIYLFSERNSNTISSLSATITGGTDGFINAVGFDVATPIDLDTDYYNYDINYNLFCHLVSPCFLPVC